MSYSIIVVILGLYTLVSPFFIIYSVKMGFLMSERPEEVAKEPFKIKRTGKKAKMDPEMKRGIDILANIDRYDGTSKGQKEIKNES